MGVRVVYKIAEQLFDPRLIGKHQLVRHFDVQSLTSPDSRIN
jgi:hypothetical protein